MDKEKLQKKLDELNEEVSEVIKKRSKFLDENMKYFAEFQIGEKLYNVSTGNTGECSGHYRYHENKSEHDTSLHCECKISSNMICDNTSRYGGCSPWVRYSDYENKTDIYIRKLEFISRCRMR